MTTAIRIAQILLAFLAGLAFWPLVVCEGVFGLLKWIFN